MTTSTSAQSLWQRVTAPLSSGPTAYAFLTFYVVACSILLLTNPRTELSTDIVFVLFMLSMLVAYRSRVSAWFKVALGAIALGIVLPYFGTLNPFYIDVATQAGIFTALALGLNVVVGFAGLLDLGYVAFFAVGAYAWAIFSTPQITEINPAWSPVDPIMFYPFLVIGLILGLITGVLLGLPVLRLRGDYLAIVTLGFGEVIRVVANNLDRPINVTNGSQGIRDIERPPLILVDLVRNLGVEADDNRLYQLFFYYLVLIILLLTVIVVARLKNSRIGRAWEAIREDEVAAVAQGIPRVRMKLLAFAIGASFAGVMGVVFAAKQLFINPPTFDLLRSINILVMVILGGMGSIPGAMLGAIIVTMLDLQILPRIAAVIREAQAAGLPIPRQFDPTQYQRLFFGLLLVVMMIFRPEGLWPDERRREEQHEVEVGEEELEADKTVASTSADTGR
ncbi:MAG: branched-chain amino acid ABC transporter permease [Chloroflexus sp.]|nr:branched-chain amino acid ABC transporter permease [Chloroflexus sp.]MBO9316451.1 branched-chain amino acid ABC transporter permease [Chloroflexus sp.]MBO9319309.1 branched-chain amino acid ABC transporter permease [Chloroflexus sp.]MBO9319343.1 branched-chain amino acid ABC transporter permease [Chloroflexus sp.]MBO9372162.1 branched-chain amino acid ABC transporter permease [Chloroflexus sp.]